MPPQLSIVIPTYHRADLLTLTLNSLLDQTAPFAQFEVIVVDNADQPDPPTQALCSKPVYRAINLRIVHEPVAGVSQARNCGIRHASAELLGFIDDDEKLAPYWVERALEISKTGVPDIFGGPYHPYYTAPKPAWFRDEYLLRSHGTVKAWLKEGQYLFGGNLFIRRTLMEQLNGFSTELGYKGNSKDRGEDMEIQLRAYRQGARILYDPDLYILHYTCPDCLQAAWFLQTGWYQGKAQARVAWQHSTTHPGALVLLKNILRDSLRLVACYLGVPLRSRKKYPFVAPYIIERVAPVVSTLAHSIFSLDQRLRSKR